MGGGVSKTPLTTESSCKLYNNCTICDKRFYVIKDDYNYLRHDGNRPTFSNNGVFDPVIVYFMHNPDGISVDLFSADSGQVLFREAKVRALKDGQTGQLENTTPSLQIMPRLGYLSTSGPLPGPVNGMVLGSVNSGGYGNQSFLSRLSGYNGESSLVSAGSTFLPPSAQPLTLQDPVQIAIGRWFSRPDVDTNFWPNRIQPTLFPLAEMEVIEVFAPLKLDVGPTTKPAIGQKYWGQWVDYYGSLPDFGFNPDYYRTNALFVYYFPSDMPANLTRIDVFARAKTKSTDGYSAGIFACRQDPPVFEGEFGNGGKMRYPITTPVDPLCIDASCDPKGNMIYDFVNDTEQDFELTLTGDMIQNLAGSYLIFSANLPRFGGFSYLELFSFSIDVIV